MVNTLKTVLGNEVRIVSDIPETYENLQHTVTLLYGVKDPVFQYNDEQSDTITFSTDKEYQFIKNKLIETLKLTVISSSTLTLNNPERMKEYNFEPADLSPPLPNESKILPTTIEINIKNSNIDEEAKQTLKNFLGAIEAFLPLENLKTALISCSICEEEIEDRALISLDKDRLITCEKCEKSTFGCICLRVSMKVLKPILLGSNKKRGSFLLIRKKLGQNEFASGSNESIPDETKGNTVEIFPSRTKHKTFKEDAKKSFRSTRRPSRSLTLDVYNNDEHESKSFLDSEDDNLSFRPKNLTQMLAKLAELGYNDTPKSMEALHMAKYQLEQAITNLLDS